MTLHPSAFLAGLIALAGATQTLGEQRCRPSLAFKDVRFSPMRPPTMQRTWTAVVSVDASGCTADARGHFQIVFARLQEFGPDSESSEDFTWAAPEVTVTLDFAPTEAIERYRIGAVAPCRCAPSRGPQ
jgi:hypothetical protein